MFLVLLDVLAMNVAMPALGRVFHVPGARWPQVVDAFTVPLALGLLPGGVLVDRLGARRSLIGGLAVFIVGTVLGTLAWSWAAVLAARAMQGAASAVMLPAGTAAIGRLWRDEGPRPRALAAWASISAVATALGPGVGGLLVQAAGWRAVFWSALPVLLPALVGTLVLLPADTSGRPAISPHADAPRCRPTPLVASVVAAAMMTTVGNGVLAVLTIHLQRSLQFGAGATGLVLLVCTVPFAALGPLSGRLVVRRGRRFAAALGFVLGAAGLATLGRLGADVVGMLPALLGIGIGLALMTSAIVGESLAAWASRPGTASGLNNAFRQAGTSAGVAVGGSIAAGRGGIGALQVTGVAAALWWALAAAVVVAAFVRR